MRNKNTYGFANGTTQSMTNNDLVILWTDEKRTVARARLYT